MDVRRKTADKVVPLLPEAAVVTLQPSEIELLKAFFDVLDRWERELNERMQ